MTDKQNLFCLMQHVIDCSLENVRMEENYRLARLYDLVESLQSEYLDFTPDDICKEITFNQAKKIILAANTVLKNSPDEIGGNQWTIDNQELAGSLVELEKAIRPDLYEGEKNDHD